MHDITSSISHDSKTIVAGIPNPYPATSYHSLIVERASLSACLIITATSPEGLIMKLPHEEAKMEGVQFHPESILTDSGRQLVANVLML